MASRERLLAGALLDSCCRPSAVTRREAANDSLRLAADVGLSSLGDRRVRNPPVAIDRRVGPLYYRHRSVRADHRLNPNERMLLAGMDWRSAPSAVGRVAKLNGGRAARPGILDFSSTHTVAKERSSRNVCLQAECSPSSQERASFESRRASIVTRPARIQRAISMTASRIECMQEFEIKRSMRETLRAMPVRSEQY